jgi:hypothetical protein
MQWRQVQEGLGVVGNMAIHDQKVNLPFRFLLCLPMKILDELNIYPAIDPTLL